MRHSALETLQAIRALSVLPELKQIALDLGWSNQDRSDAVYALASMPGDIDFPEFAPILASYVEEGLEPVQQSLENANDEFLREHFLGEHDLLNAIFRLIGMHPINRSWLLDFLAQAQPTVKAEFLTWAISSNCQYPGEPFMVGLLTKSLDQSAELMTLENLNTVANHGGVPEDQWLVAHVETIISLCLGADTSSVSSVLSYSRALTAKVAETHLEIAKLSSLFPYLEIFSEAKTTEASSDNLSDKAPADNVRAFYSSAIWQRLEQMYQDANNGNELAFDQLYELTDDQLLSVPARAAATYFLGKLWTHDRALGKLCRLARESDETWGEHGQDKPIRVQAVDALHTTGSPKAWEALVDVIFMDRESYYHDSYYHEKYLRWLNALTSQLDPSIPFEPVKEDNYYSHIEGRPWFDALTEATDDIDAILKDL